MTTAPSPPAKASATLLVVALLTLAVVIIYLPTSTFPFINFDDDMYVYKNPLVSNGLTLEGLKWAVWPDAKGDTYWQPVTWISLMLDVELFGVNPAAHHTINWLFHLANALLLFQLLKSSTGCLWKSAGIAMIFAVHPVNVESVVWIAERKNVLSLCLCLATLLAYRRYTSYPTRRGFLLSLACYALGLLTKPMLVTLPALLLLFDYWPLQRLRWPDRQGNPPGRRPTLAGVLAGNRQVLLEKVPFLALSLSLLVFTALAIGQKSNMAVSFQRVPLSLRLENLCTSFVAYLGKLVYPADPALLYPFPTSIATWQVILAVLLLGLITGLAVRNGRKRPWLTVGWFWFLITMLPVTGIIQIGVWPRMADHLIYLPEIGILLGVTWLLTELADRLRLGKRARVLFVVTVALLFLGTACRHIWYWRDSISLYQQSLAVGGPHPLILDNLSGALLEQNRPAAAIPYLKQALAMDPEQAFTLTYLGVAYAMLNQLDEASDYFQRALQKAPGYAVAQENLAGVRQQKAHFSEMRNSTQAALAVHPDSPELLVQLGVAYFKLGQTQSAIAAFNQSIRQKADNPQAYNGLGVVSLLEGNAREAIGLFTEALRLEPNFPEAQKNLLSAQTQLAYGQD